MHPRFEERSDEIRRLKARFRSAPPGRAEIERLRAEWSWAVDPAELEWLALSDLAGRPTGAVAPRWLAHLLGIPHCTVHVGLATPAGLVLLQRRSRRKAQFPDAWDMAVTGHVSFPEPDQVHPGMLQEAARRELEEELGLSASDLDHLIRGRLEPVGAPVLCAGEDERGERPWYDVEVRQLFGGVLSAEGMARLRYPDEEISAVLLCRPEEALRVTSGSEAAAGAFESLRQFISWLHTDSPVSRDLESPIVSARAHVDSPIASARTARRPPGDHTRPVPAVDPQDGNRLL